MSKHILVSIISLFFALPLAAQTWEIGGFLGGSGYMGDLNPVKPYEVKDLAFGGQIKRNFDGYFSLKLNYMHGQIQAADSLSENEHFQNRNLSFFSTVDEISLQLEFNFFNYIPTISKKRYTPYLFTGIGAVVYNPKTILNGNEYELRYMGTEGQDILEPYKNYSLSVPYGVGVKYNFSGKWNLIGEVGYRTAFTDYLDDVSGSYPDLSHLSVNSTRRILADRSVYKAGSYLYSPGTQRGDFRKRDTYMFMGFTLSYTFVTEKCAF